MLSSLVSIIHCTIFVVMLITVCSCESILSLAVQLILTVLMFFRSLLCKYIRYDNYIASLVSNWYIAQDLIMKLH